MSNALQLFARLTPNRIGGPEYHKALTTIRALYGHAAMREVIKESRDWGWISRPAPWETLADTWAI